MPPATGVIEGWGWDPGQLARALGGSARGGGQGRQSSLLRALPWLVVLAPASTHQHGLL